MTIAPQAPEAAASGVHVSNAPGTTEISVRTLERIVAQAIKSVPGTVSIDSKLAGIAGRGYPRSIVQADPDTRMTAVDTTIAVAWPSPVTHVAGQTRAAIISALSQFTGYSTTRVNVTVGHLEPGARVGISTTNTPVDFHAAIPVVTPKKITHPTTRSSATNIRGYDPEQWTDRTQVASVTTPDPTTVRSVDVPEAKPVQPSGDITKQVKEVFVPKFTPREIHLKEIKVPEESPLREIQVESANPEPSHVEAPNPPQLRHIEVREVEVFSPQIKAWDPAGGSRNTGPHDEKGARS